MNIVHIRYEKVHPFKHYMVLYLGEVGDKVICLDDSHIVPKDTELIRGNIEELNKMSLPAVETWLRRYTPLSYAAAYRTLDAKNVVILQKYDIKRPSP